MFNVVLSSLLICVLTTESHADKDAYYDKGWVPIPNDAFIKLWKDYIPNTDYKENERKVMNTALDSTENINSLRDTALKIVQPQFVDDQLTDEDISSYPVELEQLKPIKYFENGGNNCVKKAPTDGLETTFQENTEFKIRSTPETFKIKINQSAAKETQRKAKKISEQVLAQDFVGNLIKNGDTKSNINEVETSKLFSDKANDTVGENQNTYEVTENSDGIDLLNAEQSKVSDNTGYTYKPVGFNVQTLEKNAFVNRFLDKLAKNNIKVNESLSNYALSRLKNYKFPDKQTDRIISIKLPFRYNSMNHLPVDPLTAVFLSNYGYYLPGFYGLHSNYRNLYGYLASNNIHNNMPYGVYKVFSDTDSRY